MTKTTVTNVGKPLTEGGGGGAEPGKSVVTGILRVSKTGSSHSGKR